MENNKDNSIEELESKLLGIINDLTNRVNELEAKVTKLENEPKYATFG